MKHTLNAGASRWLLALVSLGSLNLTVTAAQNEPKAVPFTQRSGNAEKMRFSLIPETESGLVVRNPYDDPAMWGDLYNEFSGGSIGTGLAVGDLNGDGLPDIYVVNKTKPNQLFLNQGNLKFKDVSAEAKAPGGPTWKTGATLADVNGDGALDIYVCQFKGPNLLYVNDGKGHFTESAKKAGVALESGSVVGSFCDYDRDGWMDLFVLTNVLDANKGPDGEADHLYHNNGDGTFTEVTTKAGIQRDPGRGHAAIWFDANNDGWPDLYVSNDFTQPDHLYRNNGDGTFTDITEKALSYTPWSSMGADFGDINNDGLLDFFATDMAGTTHYKSKVTMGDMGGIVNYMDTLVTPQYMKNAVYLNSGTDRFLEISKMTGLGSSDWTWSVRFEDLDNDGWVDLHITNGMVRSFIHSDLLAKAKKLQSQAEIIALFKNSPVMKEAHLTLQNDHKLKFKKVGPDWGLAHDGVSFGSATADLDGDGDMDLVYTNFEDTLSLYRNDCPAGNSIVLELHGQGANKFGMGAQAFAHTKQGLQTRMLVASRGVLSSSEPVMHFGLGDETSVQSLELRWPGGQVQKLENLKAGYRYVVTEPSSSAKPGKAVLTRVQDKGLFEDISSKTGLNYVNKERVFDDMVRQSLLPNRMNTLGGGSALGDVNADGTPDLFFAGAVGCPSALYLGDGKGGFKRDTQAQPWERIGETEGMSAAILDVNGDGAPDILVAAGSVESDKLEEDYRSRLYLNKGKGLFEEAPAGKLAMPSTSAAPITLADFDHDGDLDVFIGGRVVPGQYPLNPRSVLLINQDGGLQDVTKKLCPALAETGMVSAALWSDVDKDGWADLVVTGEWMPLQVWHNEKGAGFTNITDKCGLADSRGWWNSLLAADVNNDGNLDFVVGNTGLNTKYKADKKHPVGVNFLDFEGTGKCQIIETKFEGDRPIPVRGRSCSSQAMPSLREKFPTFHDFGSALLPEIYGEENLKKSFRVEATELASGVFLSDGRGKFSFKELPRLAQVAPIFGMAAADFNGDGNLDLFLGENFRGPQVETGRYDGGLSLLLLGDGKGGFAPTTAEQSGIMIPGEVRGVNLQDLNADGWPDLVITRINESVLSLATRPASTAKSTAIKLKGKAGNPDAIGARVCLSYADGSKRVSDISAGSGYLCQSAPVAWVSYTEEKAPVEVLVTWPDGSETRHPFTKGKAQLTLERL